MTDEQTSAAESPPLFSVLPMPADLDNAPFPDKGPYYLVGRDRAYIHKNIHQGRVILPINPALAERQSKPGREQPTDRAQPPPLPPTHRYARPRRRSPRYR